MQYGNGGKVKYAYDAYDRLTGVKHDGETTDRYTYEYDAIGDASVIRDNHLGRVFQTQYDLANRPMGTQLRNNDGSLIYRTELDYDAQNRLVGFGETAGNTNYKTAYTYDNDNRVTGMTFDGGNAISYTYDNLGRIATRTTSPLSTTYGYVAGGYGTGSTTPLVASIQQNGISFAYSYDSRGNITSETRNGLTTTYAYDALGQLIRVNDPHENKTWVYEYDCGGNMLKRIQYAYTEGALGSAVSTRAYSYASNWKDQLITNGPYPLTYDEIGNLRTYGGWEYEWVAGRRLVKQTQNEKVVSYEYDHNGMRIRQIVSNKTSGRLYATYNYTYNGSNLVHMTVYNDELHFFYDNQGRPAKVRYNGVTYTYVHNLQGDVVGILDSAGNLVVEYKYNAWGTLLSKTGSMAGTLGHRNPFRYRGYIYDEETWMYWLKSRYYYPELHRFINADDVEYLGMDGELLSYNQYSYCRNSPINRFDAEGNWSLPNWAKAAIGVVATVAAVAVTVATGGAALPVIAGVAGNTIVSAAIGYIAGGKQGAIDGAADGLMIGGIGALAVSAIGAIKTVSAYKKTIDTYSSLRNQYKGSGMEAHHIIERRLVRGSSWNISQMPSVELTKTVHSGYTHAWRVAVPYGTRYVPGLAYKYQLYKAANTIYKGSRVLRMAARYTILKM